MNYVAFRFYHDAMHARNEAHFILRSGLPGRIIYARAKLRRAINNWRDYAKAKRAVS